MHNVLLLLLVFYILLVSFARAKDDNSLYEDSKELRTKNKYINEDDDSAIIFPPYSSKLKISEHDVIRSSIDEYRTSKASPKEIILPEPHNFRKNKLVIIENENTINNALDLQSNEYIRNDLNVNSNTKSVYKTGNEEHQLGNHGNKRNLVQFRDSSGRVIATLQDPRSWNSANVSLSKKDDARRIIENMGSLLGKKNTITRPTKRRVNKGTNSTNEASKTSFLNHNFIEENDDIESHAQMNPLNNKSNTITSNESLHGYYHDNVVKTLTSNIDINNASNITQRIVSNTQSLIIAPTITNYFVNNTEFRNNDIAKSFYKRRKKVFHGVTTNISNKFISDKNKNYTNYKQANSMKITQTAFNKSTLLKIREETNTRPTGFLGNVSNLKPIPILSIEVDKFTAISNNNNSTSDGVNNQILNKNESEYYLAAIRNMSTLSLTGSSTKQKINESSNTTTFQTSKFDKDNVSKEAGNSLTEQLTLNSSSNSDDKNYDLQSSASGDFDIDDVTSLGFDNDIVEQQSDNKAERRNFGDEGVDEKIGGNKFEMNENDDTVENSFMEDLPESEAIKGTTMPVTRETSNNALQSSHDGSPLASNKVIQDEIDKEKTNTSGKLNILTKFDQNTTSTNKTRVSQKYNSTDSTTNKFNSTSQIGKIRSQVDLFKVVDEEIRRVEIYGNDGKLDRFEETDTKIPKQIQSFYNSTVLNRIEENIKKDNTSSNDTSSKKFLKKTSSSSPTQSIIITNNLYEAVGTKDENQGRKHDTTTPQALTGEELFNKFISMATKEKNITNSVEFNPANFSTIGNENNLSKSLLKDKLLSRNKDLWPKTENSETLYQPKKLDEPSEPYQPLTEGINVGEENNKNSGEEPQYFNDKHFKIIGNVNPQTSDVYNDLSDISENQNQYFKDQIVNNQDEINMDLDKKDKNNIDTLSFENDAKKTHISTDFTTRTKIFKHDNSKIRHTSKITRDNVQTISDLKNTKLQSNEEDKTHDVFQTLLKREVPNDETNDNLWSSNYIESLDEIDPVNKEHAVIFQTDISKRSKIPTKPKKSHKKKKKKNIKISHNEANLFLKKKDGIYYPSEDSYVHQFIHPKNNRHFEEHSLYNKVTKDKITSAMPDDDDISTISEILDDGEDKATKSPIYGRTIKPTTASTTQRQTTNAITLKKLEVTTKTPKLKHLNYDATVTPIEEDIDDHKENTVKDRRKNIKTKEDYNEDEQVSMISDANHGKSHLQESDNIQTPTNSRVPMINLIHNEDEDNQNHYTSSKGKDDKDYPNDEDFYKSRIHDIDSSLQKLQHKEHYQLRKGQEKDVYGNEKVQTREKENFSHHSRQNTQERVSEEEENDYFTRHRFKEDNSPRPSDEADDNLYKSKFDSFHGGRDVEDGNSKQINKEPIYSDNERDWYNKGKHKVFNDITDQVSDHYNRHTNELDREIKARKVLSDDNTSKEIDNDDSRTYLSNEKYPTSSRLHTLATAHVQDPYDRENFYDAKKENQVMLHKSENPIKVEASPTDSYKIHLNLITSPTEKGRPSKLHYKVDSTTDSGNHPIKTGIQRSGDEQEDTDKDSSDVHPTRININLHLKEEDPLQEEDIVAKQSQQKDFQDYAQQDQQPDESTHQNTLPRDLDLQELQPEVLHENDINVPLQNQQENQIQEPEEIPEATQHFSVKAAEKVITLPIDIIPNTHSNHRIKDSQMEDNLSVFKHNSRVLNYETAPSEQHQYYPTDHITPEILKQSLKDAFRDLAKDIKSKSEEERSKFSAEDPAALAKHLVQPDPYSNDVASFNMKENKLSFENESKIKHEDKIPTIENKTFFSNSDVMHESGKNKSTTQKYSPRDDRSTNQPSAYQESPTRRKSRLEHEEEPVKTKDNNNKSYYPTLDIKKNIPKGFYLQYDKKYFQNNTFCNCDPKVSPSCLCKSIKPTISEKSQRRQDGTFPPYCFPPMSPYCQMAQLDVQSGTPNIQSPATYDQQSTVNNAPTPQLAQQNLFQPSQQETAHQTVEPPVYSVKPIIPIERSQPVQYPNPNLHYLQMMMHPQQTQQIPFIQQVQQPYISSFHPIDLSTVPPPSPAMASPPPPPPPPPVPSISLPDLPIGTVPSLTVSMQGTAILPPQSDLCTGGECTLDSPSQCLFPPCNCDNPPCGSQYQNSNPNLLSQDQSFYHPSESLLQTGGSLQVSCTNPPCYPSAESTASTTPSSCQSPPCFFDPLIQQCLNPPCDVSDLSTNCQNPPCNINYEMSSCPNPPCNQPSTEIASNQVVPDTNCLCNGNTVCHCSDQSQTESLQHQHMLHQQQQPQPQPQPQQQQQQQSQQQPQQLQQQQQYQQQDQYQQHHQQEQQQPNCYNPVCNNAPPCSIPPCPQACTQPQPCPLPTQPPLQIILKKLPPKRLFRIVQQKVDPPKIVYTTTQQQQPQPKIIYTRPTQIIQQDVPPQAPPPPVPPRIIYAQAPPQIPATPPPRRIIIQQQSAPPIPSQPKIVYAVPPPPPLPPQPTVMIPPMIQPQHQVSNTINSADLLKSLSSMLQTQSAPKLNAVPQPQYQRPAIVQTQSIPSVTNSVPSLPPVQTSAPAIGPPAFSSSIINQPLNTQLSQNTPINVGNSVQANTITGQSFSNNRPNMNNNFPKVSQNRIVLENKQASYNRPMMSNFRQNQQTTKNLLDRPDGTFIGPRKIPPKWNQGYDMTSLYSRQPEIGLTCMQNPNKPGCAFGFQLHSGDKVKSLSDKTSDGIEKLVKGMSQKAQDLGDGSALDIEERISDAVAEAIVDAKKNYNKNKKKSKKSKSLQKKKVEENNALDRSYNLIDPVVQGGLTRHLIAPATGALLPYYTLLMKSKNDLLQPRVANEQPSKKSTTAKFSTISSINNAKVSDIKAEIWNRFLENKKEGSLKSLLGPNFQLIQRQNYPHFADSAITTRSSIAKNNPLTVKTPEYKNIQLKSEKLMDGKQKKIIASIFNTVNTLQSAIAHKPISKIDMKIQSLQFPHPLKSSNENVSRILMSYEKTPVSRVMERSRERPFLYSKTQSKTKNPFEKTDTPILISTELVGKTKAREDNKVKINPEKIVSNLKTNKSNNKINEAKILQAIKFPSTNIQPHLLHENSHNIFNLIPLRGHTLSLKANMTENLDSTYNIKTSHQPSIKSYITSKIKISKPSKLSYDLPSKQVHKVKAASNLPQAKHSPITQIHVKGPSNIIAFQPKKQRLSFDHVLGTRVSMKRKILLLSNHNVNNKANNEKGNKTNKVESDKLPSTQLHKATNQSKQTESPKQVHKGTTTRILNNHIAAEKKNPLSIISKLSDSALLMINHKLQSQYNLLKPSEHVALLNRKPESWTDKSKMQNALTNKYGYQWKNYEHILLKKSNVERNRKPLHRYIEVQYNLSPTDQQFQPTVKKLQSIHNKLVKSKIASPRTIAHLQNTIQSIVKNFHKTKHSKRNRKKSKQFRRKHIKVFKTKKRKRTRKTKKYKSLKKYSSLKQLNNKKDLITIDITDDVK